MKKKKQKKLEKKLKKMKKKLEKNFDLLDKNKLSAEETNLYNMGMKIAEIEGKIKKNSSS